MLTLRPYQQEALEALTRAQAQGKQRVILRLATGGGKTLIFVRLVSLLARHGRVLILVNREELVHQTLAKLEQMAPDLEIGVVKADRNETLSPVVLASVQTLARWTRLQQLAQHWQLIICDECHHVDGELVPAEGPPTAEGVGPQPCLVGNSWVRVLQHCGAWNGSFTVGCSATPYRPNGQSIIGAIFEATAYHKPLLHLMREGYLCDLMVKRLHVAGMDLKRVKTVAGDYRADDLEDAMFKANAPAQIVNGLLQYAHDRRIAIFSPGIAHAEAITALCRDRGLTAQTIIGATPWETRQAAYEAVSAGTLQVLSSVMVLTEGFDLPSIDCVVLARATRSKVLFAQALGRGLRLSQETGKQNCLLLDATGATERHNLFSVAELLGLSEATLSEEQSVLEAVAAQDEAETEADAPAQRAETVQATAVDLVRRAALSWVETPRGAFALSMAGSTFRIRYENTERSRWTVELKQKDTRQYQRLEAGLPLPYAFGVAEDTARSMGLARATAKEAQWRLRPPSPGQVQVCQKLGIVVDPRWTQGAVSDAITKVTAEWYWPPR